MNRILIINCTSFTGVMLLFSVFSKYDMAPVVNSTVTFQVFILTLSIAVVMSIAEKIENKLKIYSALADMLIRVVICYTLVFIQGGLFGWFEYSVKALLTITPVCIPVFIVTYLVLYLTCVECADAINKSIKRKK